MSKKATTSSRTAAKALKVSNRNADEARLASDAARLAKDAVAAAVAAACAAERASIAADDGKMPDAASMKSVVQKVRAASEEAVFFAKDAMSAGEDDVIGSVWSANLSANAAQRAGSLAAAAAILAGRAREMASEREATEPAITVRDERGETPAERMRRELDAAIDRSANYLVTYDSKIIATFASADDAFLLEGELADMDRARGRKHGKCEVLDRRTGHRLGGYLLTGDEMLLFSRDERYEKRFGRQGRR